MFKIRHHEFWNTHLFHLPIYLYWLYLACKARSLFFFSAANPGIETGGLMGESKFKILQKIDSQYLPATIQIQPDEKLPVVIDKITAASIKYPFVVKPDIGQGGWLIDLICDEQDLETFLSKIKMPFMIQEFVEDPLEFGVLYYRHPDWERGRISSIAMKELLTVTGDGVNSIDELMRRIPRAKKQLQRMQCSNRVDLKRVPVKGEQVNVSFVGNHSYGTTFRNANQLITPELTKTFDKVCKNIGGFYFGRFDLRCQTIEDLSKGNFKILELNGVGSEPLHIFDPNEKILNAYRSAFDHWRVIYDISRKNVRKIAPYMNLSQAWDIYKNVLHIQKVHNTNFTIGN